MLGASHAKVQGMGLTVNTARAHATYRRGDLTLILTWVNDERAMVLAPTYRKETPLFIVTDSVAWRYDDPRYLARMSIKAAEVIGMEGQEARIGAFLHDHLGDLVTMPSAPPQRLTRATFGEIKFLRGGEEVGGEEARAVIADGAEYVGGQ